ncbi:MAG: hypothetical protein ACJ79L_20150 [Anaeromyxobacteraceae bacterium]
MMPLLVALVPLLLGQAGGQGTAAMPRAANPADPSVRPERSTAESKGDVTPTPPSTSTSTPTSNSTANPTPTPAQNAPPAQNANAPQPSPDQQALAALNARLSALEAELASSRDERARDAARIQELESALAQERERRAAAERDPAARGQALAGASGALTGADQALASGSASGVGAALDQASALAADTQAHAQRSPVEAALASDAQRYLADAQSALARGDLFQARQATSLALDAVARARGMNSAARGGR